MLRNLLTIPRTALRFWRETLLPPEPPKPRRTIYACAECGWRGNGGPYHFIPDTLRVCDHVATLTTGDDP